MKYKLSCNVDVLKQSNMNNLKSDFTIKHIIMIFRAVKLIKVMQFKLGHWTYNICFCVSKNGNFILRLHFPLCDFL